MCAIEAAMQGSIWSVEPVAVHCHIRGAQAGVEEVGGQDHTSTCTCCTGGEDMRGQTEDSEHTKGVLGQLPGNHAQGAGNRTDIESLTLRTCLI